MQKAQQELMIQQTNLQLIQIRLLELTYFQNVINFFGNQAILLGGFLITVLSNYGGLITLQKKLEDETLTESFFAITLSLALGFTMLSMICATYVEVFAFSLAIRGPEGSLDRAIQGVLIELDVIFYSSMLGMFFWAICLSVVAFMWTTPEASLPITAIIIIFSYFWYSYCVRIYNRFKFKQITIRDKFDNITANPLTATPVVYEGFMTKKGISLSSLLNDPYARRYFVLKGRYLFYYSTRNEYRDDPSATIKSKPIDLVGYNVNRVVEGNSFKLILESNKKELEFRQWEFVLDSEEDMIAWHEAFEKVLTAEREKLLQNDASGRSVDTERKKLPGEDDELIDVRSTIVIK